MLWTQIFYFYVQYIFGGVINAEIYYGSLGTFYDGSNWSVIYTYSPVVNIFGVDMHLGNYLSFIATLITIVIILILCCLFIKKIISLMGKLFSGGTL